MNTLNILRLFIVMLLVLRLPQNYVAILIPDDLNIKISSITECQNIEGYPLEVNNVIVSLNKGKIIATGTLIASVDLVSPITAVVKVEKDELGVWIEVPCVNNIGSCTYNDLCIHGIPNNETCPENFINNNVPCRCPIAKGTYTIPPSLEFDIPPSNYSSVYSGSYWARILLSHKNVILTCYEVYFQIEEKNTYEDNRIDRPFVVLI